MRRARSIGCVSTCASCPDPGPFTTARLARDSPGSAIPRDPHGTQRVRHHDAHEFPGRDIGNRFAIVVLDAGIHEQHVQLPPFKTAAQRRHLLLNRDVDSFGFECATRGFSGLLQLLHRPLPPGGDHAPAALEVFLDHGEAESARCTDEEDGLLPQ